MVRAHGFLEPLRLLAVAVGFLTRVPVPRVDIGVDDLRRATAFFPLVGLGVAGVGIAVRAAVAPIWGTGVATVGAIAAMILVTGAFHEDGLADTADGLWGGRDRAARLAIMHDSRIGTYGAIALVIVIALRASLLLPLGLTDFARAVACGHVLARASTLLLARLLPPAGESSLAEGITAAGGSSPAGDAPPVGDSPVGDSPVGDSLRAGAAPPVGGPLPTGDVPPVGGPLRAGAASRLAHSPPTREARAGGRHRLGASVVGPLGAWGIGVAVVVVGATLGLAARAWAPIPLAAGLVVGIGCARLFRRRLGGVTGDAFGAANQLVELAAVAAIVALARAGLL